VDVADDSVAPYRHGLAAGRDRDLRLVGGRRRERVRAGVVLVADHEQAILVDEVALAVEREVAGACVRVAGAGADRARVGAPELAVACDRAAERVPRLLDRARLHVVLDRAELDAEADLLRVRAAEAGGRAGGAALELRERVLERRLLALVAD